jgi:hypothetical protein
MHLRARGSRLCKCWSSAKSRKRMLSARKLPSSIWVRTLNCTIRVRLWAVERAENGTNHHQEPRWMHPTKTLNLQETTCQVTSKTQRLHKNKNKKASQLSCLNLNRIRSQKPFKSLVLKVWRNRQRSQRQRPNKKARSRSQFPRRNRLKPSKSLEKKRNKSNSILMRLQSQLSIHLQTTSRRAKPM